MRLRPVAVELDLVNPARIRWGMIAQRRMRGLYETGERRAPRTRNEIQRGAGRRAITARPLPSLSGTFDGHLPGRTVTGAGQVQWRRECPALVRACSGSNGTTGGVSSDQMNASNYRGNSGRKTGCLDSKRRTGWYAVNS